MIANCPGCQEEYNYLLEILTMQEEFDYFYFPSITKSDELYFAGTGLFEKGHLCLIMVNDKGEIIIG